MGKFLCKRCDSKIEYFSEPISLSLPNCALDEAWSMALYKEPLASAITTLKYKSIKGLGELLGEMLSKRVTFTQPAIITAVPLHQKRKRERGFNQAEVIARTMAKRKQVQYSELLQRSKFTTSQVAAGSREARLSQLQGAFTLNPKIAKNIPDFLHKEIVLIDDVLTTGSTLNECAIVLKQSGFSRVCGLTIAHGVV